MPRLHPPQTPSPPPPPPHCPPLDPPPPYPHPLKVKTEPTAAELAKIEEDKKAKEREREASRDAMLAALATLRKQGSVPKAQINSFFFKTHERPIFPICRTPFPPYVRN